MDLKTLTGLIDELESGGGNPLLDSKICVALEMPQTIPASQDTDSVYELCDQFGLLMSTTAGVKYRSTATCYSREVDDPTKSKSNKMGVDRTASVMMAAMIKMFIVLEESRG